MTVPDPQAIRDAADRAEQLQYEPTRKVLTATPKLLEVLVPAARTAADLLDAIGDPKELHKAAFDCDDDGLDDLAAILRVIADAAAAARGDRTDG